MSTIYEILTSFLDTLTGHLALTAYLLAVTDERAVWRRLKKLPMLLHLAVTIPAALLLYRLQSGKWFRPLLDSETAPWRTALLLFALEASMEIFLRLAGGVQSQYLPFYYLLVAVMVILMAALVVYLGQRFDTARKIQTQQDVIAQQWLYEQDLELIRREVCDFRYDYKNLLAQAGRVFLRVSNPYTNSIDPGKIWREGWSTKGTGRGVGLSGYQRILGSYPNASHCTSWENGVFVQELTVEGRL